MNPTNRKRCRLRLTEEAFAVVKAIKAAANKDFVFGKLSYSDVVNELLICSKVDIKKLQKKHTNVKSSLLAMASQQDIDIETAIKNLKDLKHNKTSIQVVPS